MHCEYKFTSTTSANIDYAVETSGDDHIKVAATESDIAIKKLKGGIFACGSVYQTAKYSGDTTVEALNEETETNRRKHS